MVSKELRCDKLWNGGDNSNTNNGKSYHITASFKVFQWLQSQRAEARDPWGP